MLFVGGIDVDLEWQGYDGMAWYSIVRYSTVWYDMVYKAWYSMAWYGTL